MPNLWTRLILFLSSYSPLFLIIAIRGWHDNWHLAVALSCVAIASVIVLFLFLHTVHNLAADKVAISSVASRDGAAMSYIVTYLLPFLAVNLNDIADITSLGIVLVVIGLLYINSNLIYTNPVLNIAGYHIFEIKDDEGKTIALISARSYVEAGSQISAVSVGDYVLLETRHATSPSP